MDNFDWTSFTRRIAISAKLSELYDAWSIPEEIERWFLRTATYSKPNGDTMARSKGCEKNDLYAWSWFLYDVTETGRIIEANGKDLLKFTFAGECTVQVRLLQHESDVVVELTQSNIPTDNKSKQGIRIGCDSGWSFFLVNLKSVYEGGIDLRNKDERHQGMINN